MQQQLIDKAARVTYQGKTRWMIIEEAFDAGKFIEFLQALIIDAGKSLSDPGQPAGSPQQAGQYLGG